MKKFLLGLSLPVVAIAVLFAQEPQRFERGLEIIRGNILMGGTIGNRLCYEGATADAFETCLAASDVTADVVITLPLSGSADAAFVMSTLTTNSVDIVNSIWGVSNGLAFEGATADAFELTMSPGDVGVDTTVTLPAAGVSYAVALSTLTTNNVDAANSIWLVSAGIVFEGATADANEATVTFVDPAADGTLTFTLAGQVAGEQLQTNGSGVLTWEAAGSSREMKDLLGRLTPAEGLAALLSTPVYRFHYKRDAQVTTGDFLTEYVGVLADEAPWAMHHHGKILNPVNTFGYTVLAIQALEARIAELERAR